MRMNKRADALGKLIRKERIASNLTQKQLAAQAGIKTSELSPIEDGAVFQTNTDGNDVPRASTSAICKIFGIDLPPEVETTAEEGKRIGAKIEAARIAANLTPAQLAELANVKQSEVRSIKRGRSLIIHVHVTSMGLRNETRRIMRALKIED